MSTSPIFGSVRIKFNECIRRFEQNEISQLELLEAMNELFSRQSLRSTVIREAEDSHLREINSSLAWATVSRYMGRVIGAPYGPVKRSQIQELPTRRVSDLNNVLTLKGRVVLDVGCLEGADSVSMVHFGAKTIGIDFQTTNLIGAIVRSWAYGTLESTRFEQCDIDRRELLQVLRNLDVKSVDLIYASGVLYHLADPFAFLREAAEVSESIFISTQIASAGSNLRKVNFQNLDVEVTTYREPVRAPFTGSGRESIWLTRNSLLSVLEEVGFPNITVLREEEERNGPRIDLLARRRKLPRKIPSRPTEAIEKLVREDSREDSAGAVRLVQGDLTRRLLVVGPARSGTTLITRILESLGFHNPGASSPSAELAAPASQGSIESYVYELFSILDRSDVPVVLKSPKLSSEKVSSLVMTRLRESPLVSLVAVVRNPMRIANTRHRLRTEKLDIIDSGYVQELGNAVAAVKGTIELIGSGNPTLLVSGDSMLEFPQAVVLELADAFGISSAVSVEKVTREALSWKAHYEGAQVAPGPISD